MSNTVDSIFWIYDRDSTSANCPCSAKEGCDCCECVSVKPLHQVGDKRVPMSFHRRSYARWDTTCPICLDPLLTASNTYITTCGHAFHRRCFLSMAEHQWSNNDLTRTKCPTCRTTQSVWGLNEGRYNGCSFIDDLDNFWDTIQDKYPKRCFNKNEPTHYLGMRNKNCPNCQHYVLGG
jgi:hypothetical protein